MPVAATVTEWRLTDSVLIDIIRGILPSWCTIVLRKSEDRHAFIAAHSCMHHHRLDPRTIHDRCWAAVSPSAFFGERMRCLLFVLAFWRFWLGSKQGKERGEGGTNRKEAAKCVCSLSAELGYERRGSRRARQSNSKGPCVRGVPKKS